MIINRANRGQKSAPVGFDPLAMNAAAKSPTTPINTVYIGHCTRPNIYKGAHLSTHVQRYIHSCRTIPIHSREPYSPSQTLTISLQFLLQEVLWRMTSLIINVHIGPLHIRQALEFCL